MKPFQKSMWCWNQQVHEEYLSLPKEWGGILQNDPTRSNMAILPLVI